MASLAVELALNKLSDLATNETTLLGRAENKMVDVKIKLQQLLEFLADADEKHRDGQREQVSVWVSQLREAAYDLEDVLDEFTVKLDLLRRRGLYGWKASPWLHCFISPMKHIFIRRDLASQIVKVNQRLDVISHDRVQYLDNIIVSSTWQKESHKDKTNNMTRTEVESDSIGQDYRVEDIKARLLNSNRQGITVISIVGMGGIGKTTLARRLYNDEKVVSHFNSRAWLIISQRFSVTNLLRNLMDQLTLEDGIMEMNQDQMKTKLEEHLRKRSIIIVLDDVWEISPLEPLQAIFPEENKGITVLLTTRIMYIATDWNKSSMVFQLPVLDRAGSWQLFCKRAFIDANFTEDHLIFKGEVIKMCSGSPLAISVLGGLLRRRNDPNYWRKVLDHISAKSEQEHSIFAEYVYSILALSYDLLPVTLKACFVYVAGYPRSSYIEARTLKLLWIAEGFIQQQQGHTMEDLTEEYLEELIQRSLIELVERDATGQVSIIRVHDLIYDMASYQAPEIKFLDKCFQEQSSLLARRLSLSGEDEILGNFDFQSCNSNLRSLRFFGIGAKSELPSSYFDFVPKQFLLRVLSLKGMIFQDGKCPEKIGKMSQLRYLSFAATNLTELANSISNLQNLQTLDIRDTEVTQLPKKFWEIKSLRHVLGWKFNLQDMSSKFNESGRPNYKWLQNLSNIREVHLCGGSAYEDPRKEVERKLVATIESLKHLNILVLEGVLASIKVLTASNTSLRHLTLRNRKGENVERKRRSDPVPKQFLPNLLKLVLWDFNPRQDDIDVIGLLPKLAHMTITKEHELTEMVFKQGHFSSLQELGLVECGTLKRWATNVEFLIQLVQIHNCPLLKYLPKEIQVKEVQVGHSIPEEVQEWAKEIRAHKRYMSVTASFLQLV